ncbi:hypothetical protein COCMIDRAFT_100522 [Bipolaris oryzae ATCC 44560]|uniref:Major facilitator superfamily (MFS) profile domain-containing protein n=1 Tax=Bipolaris oryzae ATCC 44560 TaxID=930090 RepID=W6Z7M1_COCMI|nr:uncharacterized protein COCMIDRAFT_100522 [Bipolaris oryzae ATCC 44560]EUC43579.1 hypothetical protein COCMIDRAFT_100522 [Bipolaris oryzae ATCC 44560]
MAPATVELDTLDSGRHSQDANNTQSHLQTTHDESTLPPVDSGKAAWLFLAACWAVEAFVFGFGFSFGVFQDFYSTHEPFAGSGDIAVIGTTTLGTLYMGTPFVLMLCRLLPRWARWFTLLGLFTSTLSMAMSSFCTTVPQLIGTQGLMFGIGGCFAYCPCVVYIDEWFAKRKGMAYGVMWSAAGTGGVVLPLVLQVLLNNLGFETATRIWAGIFFAATLPLSFFIKPRLPNSATTHISPFNVRHLMSKLFALHQLFNFIQATGYFLPGIYLPTYARRIFGASDFLSTLTIMLVNISATIGCVIMGWMTDKLKVTTCIVVSALGTAMSVLVIWGLATSLPVLYVFCVFYGLFAGSWTSVYPGIMRDVAKKGESAGHSSADPVVVMGYLLLARGIGNIVSGPLSEALVEGEPWRGQASAGYGSGYGALLVYSGVTALFSGTSFVLDYLGWL